MLHSEKTHIYIIETRFRCHLVDSFVEEMSKYWLLFVHSHVLFVFLFIVMLGRSHGKFLPRPAGSNLLIPCPSTVISFLLFDDEDVILS